MAFIRIVADWITCVVNGLRLLNTLALIPALVILLLADILLRSLWLAPIPWAQELVGLLLLSLFLTGVPVVAAAGDWLAVDFINAIKNPLIQRLVRVLSLLGIVLFSLLFAAVGGYATGDMLDYQESSRLLGIPYWPFTLLMCVSGLLAALVTVFQYFRPADPDSGSAPP